jgi:hypothetical protein
VSSAIGSSIGEPSLLQTVRKSLDTDRFQSLVETGIVKHLLKRDLPSTTICPLNLRSTDRQLRNGDLFTTYMVVVVGFISSIVAFTGEVRTHSNNKKSGRNFTYSIMADISNQNKIVT